MAECQSNHSGALLLESLDLLGPDLMLTSPHHGNNGEVSNATFASGSPRLGCLANN